MQTTNQQPEIQDTRAAKERRLDCIEDFYRRQRGRRARYRRYGYQRPRRSCTNPPKSCNKTNVDNVNIRSSQVTNPIVRAIHADFAARYGYVPALATGAWFERWQRHDAEIARRDAAGIGCNNLEGAA